MVAGGDILAVASDVVGSTSGRRQRLEGHRVHPASVVVTLAGLPGLAQPGPGRSGGVGPDRRLPALGVGCSGLCCPTHIGDGGLAKPLGGRVGGGVAAGWSATGDAWPGRCPVAAAAIPPTDSTATSAAAAALIVNTLWGTAVLRGERVGGVDRITAVNSPRARC